MSDWAAWPIALFGVLAALGLAVAAGSNLYYRYRYLDHIVRIFEEKPLFVIPRGKPLPHGEEVHFEAGAGLTLRGYYVAADATRTNRGPRKGVILFGLEFGSNRWALTQYCSTLLNSGYDVFAYEPRNQGESDRDPDYDPLQWVTDRDVADLRSAIAYLKRRKDAPANGIGLFGVSKGGSVGLMAAATDPWVRCVATDGAYGTYTTIIPYMRRWVSIYIKTPECIRNRVPAWFYGLIGQAAVRESAERRGVKFVSVERAVKRLAKPLLMIHGAADTYIKAEMAFTLYGHARTPHKAIWMVPGAKHNQALHVAPAEYERKLAAFFDAHLAAEESAELTAAEAPLPSEPGLVQLRLAG